MKQSHKTLLLWVLLILMFVAIYQLVTNEDPPRNVDYSDFVTAVENGHVESVEIRPHDLTTDIQFVYVDDNERRETRTTDANSRSVPGLEEMLRQHGIQYRNEEADSNGMWTSVLVTWLPMIFLLVIFFFFMRQLQASGGKAMSFGKSRARLLNESQNKVTFADVAGVDEAKDDCEEIIAFLKDPKKFQRLGGRIPKG
ncbi:MAG: ATP-dependent metallopeptidase FtsH/Yme1/Tma family protein, partial [Myxococcales bacterium]|nr:ATP-dependent metallopeptidase FtsH/Yme1/Tma family protein [Myxococcales bacterium]